MPIPDKVGKDFPNKQEFAAAIDSGVKEQIETDLTPVKADLAEQKATLTSLTAQVATVAASVAAITSALGVIKAAVAKAQATADKAQATADSKPGGEGSGGYTLIIKWAPASGSVFPSGSTINTSITAQGRNVSKQLTTAQSSSLSGLTSGSVVTFAVDIGNDNTVLWKDPSADNPNLTGRSNFYKTYSGFKVPATTGTKTIIAEIG